MKKIVIIGPESTGKSTLCQQLATHYDTVWCPEYAREYLLENTRQYTYESLLHISKGQLVLEEKIMAEARNEKYFIDTDMNVMKVWCEVAFENCHKWILQQIAERHYDFYLLCNTDLPWQADELREYPDIEFRQKLHAMYKDILVNGRTPWAEVSGSEEHRLQMAIGHIESRF